MLTESEEQVIDIVFEGRHQIAYSNGTSVASCVCICH
jgi:hypothetical protein